MALDMQIKEEKYGNMKSLILKIKIQKTEELERLM
jgi:hypothetical protein